MIRPRGARKRKEIKRKEGGGFLAPNASLPGSGSVPASGELRAGTQVRLWTSCEDKNDPSLLSLSLSLTPSTTLYKNPFPPTPPPLFFFSYKPKNPFPFLSLNPSKPFSSTNEVAVSSSFSLCFALLCSHSLSTLSPTLYLSVRSSWRSRTKTPLSEKSSPRVGESWCEPTLILVLLFWVVIVLALGFGLLLCFLLDYLQWAVGFDCFLQNLNAFLCGFRLL